MKYLIKYESFAKNILDIEDPKIWSREVKKIEKLLNTEMAIYEKYFRSYFDTDENISHKHAAYDENEDIDGFHPSWVAMFNYNIHSVYGMFQATYTSVTSVDIDSGIQEKKYEQNLFINLNFHEGLMPTFFETELKRKQNLFSLLQKSNKKGYNIQIVFEVYSNTDLIHQVENIYNGDNLYVNILNEVKFSKIWYQILPKFFQYASDNLVIEWWNKLSSDNRIHKFILVLKKQYKNIWKRINSIFKYNKTDIDKSKNLDDMGFTD